jgi:hypothetical protein
MKQVGLSKLLVAFRDAVVAQSIAFLHARGQEQMRVEAVGLQDEMHQRHRRHAIDVVVAVEHDFSLFSTAAQDALHGGVHFRQHGGIAQRGELGHQEITRLLRRGDARAAPEAAP